MRLISLFLVLIVFFPALCLGKIRIGHSPSDYVEVSTTNQHYLLYVRYMTVPMASQSGATWDAGNDITGKTDAQIQAIVDAIKALETNPRQREIYDKMNSTPNEWFTFYDVNHAKAVVIQRLETVGMMETFNRTGYYDYCRSNPAAVSSPYWEPGPKGAEIYFRQKSGTAYVAITSLCDGSSRTLGECWGACVACIWWGASRGMGEAPFNQLYSGSTALNMHADINIGTWYRNIKVSVDDAIHVPGDWVYFKNYNYDQVTAKVTFVNNLPLQDVHGFYKLEKKLLDIKEAYLWSGENALYYGNGQYAGLGVSAKTAHLLKAEIAGKYNTQLEKLIKEAEKTGGAIDGLEIKEIKDGEIDLKISLISIKRVTHEKEL